MSSETASNVSSFARSVYELISLIPRGRVMTYRGVAEALECRSAQAVGQALKRNPFAPEVPCHRVIRSDRTIGGFEGEKSGISLQRKYNLLAAEGVLFEDGKLVEPWRLWSPRERLISESESG